MQNPVKHPEIPPVFDMFGEDDDEPVKKRHSSGSSIDSIEKLRLQALETLKSRALEQKSPRGKQTSSKRDESDEEYDSEDSLP